MPPDYVILIIFGAALYYYVHTSTDRSLISQIFDDCRQQCVSTHSNLSGLSGLQGTSQSPSNAQSEPTQACLCSSCPCAFIRIFINPVSQMYTLIIGTMLQLYYNLTQSMEEIQAHVSNVLNCAATCQRQPQMVGPSTYGSKETFRFHERNAKPVEVDGADDKTKIPETSSKLSLLPKKSAELLSKLTKPKEKSEGKSHEAISEGTGLSSESDSRSRVSCPKCVEKNKVCLGECPKSKK